VHFTAKSKSKIDININFEDIWTYTLYNIKFLGLTIDNTLSLKKQIEQLASQLSSAGVFFLSDPLSQLKEKSLITIYFSYVHSTMSYRVIHWGNLPYSNSIFKDTKRTIWIMMNAKYTDSCHPLFKKLDILPLHSQYIFSSSTFVVTNTDAFKLNAATHNIDTRQGFDLHPSITHLTKAQKRVCYSRIKFSIIYNQTLSNYLMIQTNLNWFWKRFF
jgi:hypothetical protein